MLPFFSQRFSSHVLKAVVPALLCLSLTPAMGQGIADTATADKPGMFKVTKATYQEFLKESSERLMIADFGSKNCGGCVVMEKELAKIAQEGKGKFRIGKISTDEMGNVATEFHISIIPAIIAFKDGREIGRRIGFDICKGPQYLRNWINQKQEEWQAGAPAHVPSTEPITPAPPPYSLDLTAENLEDFMKESSERLMIASFQHVGENAFDFKPAVEADQGKWRLGEVDLEKQPTLEEKYFIDGPTVIAYRHGKEIGRTGGYLHKNEIREFVDRMLALR